jgi:hypothetical protein
VYFKGGGNIYSRVYIAVLSIAIVAQALSRLVLVGFATKDEGTKAVTVATTISTSNEKVVTKYL